MQNVDLNLLVSLDALLSERSVTGAARRLGLSASAMSRTLARLRSATGDPLLVQAGRALVPTPYAEELSEYVQKLARDAQAVLRPRGGRLDLASLDRTFTIRTSEAFLEFLSAPLVARIIATAPHVRVRFAAKPDKDAQPLRDGSIDLEIGLCETSAPEVRTQLLFRDSYVGAVRAGHPLLAKPVTPEAYAACGHVAAARRHPFPDLVGDALQKLGLHRNIVVMVPGYPDAMRIARNTHLVALIPRSCLGNALETDHSGGSGLQSFELPVEMPEFAISLIWHPRLDADPAHRWLRETVIAVCRSGYP